MPKRCFPLFFLQDIGMLLEDGNYLFAGWNLFAIDYSTIRLIENLMCKFHKVKNFTTDLDNLGAF